MSMAHSLEQLRSPVQIRQLQRAIEQVCRQLPERGRPLQIMEICGGHTRAIYRYGLDHLLPARLELIHGPGCPVCVLPNSAIAQAGQLACAPDVLLCCYGDVLRVPGPQGSLQELRARGAQVRIVYSPLDALQLARQHPQKKVVFFAIGFETTAPATAMTLLRAHKEKRSNFFLLSKHIRIEPALRTVLEQDSASLDGFIGPGHVSMVTGASCYQFVAREYHKPLVVCGFEPVDLLQALLMLLKQIQQGEARIENQYQRVVTMTGNAQASRSIDRVFEFSCDHWQGLGERHHSGMKLRAEFSHFDASNLLSTTEAIPVSSYQDCCDQVLLGHLPPKRCPHFGNSCTPATPQGALMVSQEGACAACWQYDQTKLPGRHHE